MKKAEMNPHSSTRRQTLPGLAVAGVLLLLGVFLAPPASAATLSGTVTVSDPDISAGYATASCAAWIGWNVPIPSNQFVFTPSSSGAQTFSLTSSTWDSSAHVTVFDTVYSQATCLGSSSASGGGLPSLTLNLTAGHTYLIVVWGCSGNCAVTSEMLGSYTLSYPGGTDPDLTPWHQSYQRNSTEEACRVGWNPSWQQWPHQGTGGWVCTRTVLAYAPLPTDD